MTELVRHAVMVVRRQGSRAVVTARSQIAGRFRMCKPSGGRLPVTTGHYRLQIITLVGSINGIWRLLHGIRVIPTARSGTWRVQTAAIRLQLPH